MTTYIYITMNITEKDKFMRNYRITTESFGEEPKQVDVKKNMPRAAKKKRGIIHDNKSREMSEFDSFWALRKDARWTEIPGYFKCVQWEPFRLPLSFHELP